MHTSWTCFCLSTINRPYPSSTPADSISRLKRSRTSQMTPEKSSHAIGWEKSFHITDLTYSGHDNHPPIMEKGHDSTSTANEGTSPSRRLALAVVPTPLVSITLTTITPAEDASRNYRMDRDFASTQRRLQRPIVMNSHSLIMVTHYHTGTWLHLT